MKLFAAFLVLSMAPCIWGHGKPCMIKDLNEDEVVQSARAAVLTLDSKIKSEHQLQLVKILGGTQQVVAGYLFTLALEVGVAKDCTRDIPVTERKFGDCEVDPDSIFLHEFQVLHQPWRKQEFTIEGEHGLDAFEGYAARDCDDPHDTNTPKKCLHEKDPGPCKAAFKRFAYDKKNMQCEEFTYGGCRGNGNNFESEEDCERECMATDG